MSIKARLLVAISVAVAAALLLIGVVTVALTRDQLIGRVDETLVSAANKRPPHYAGNDNQPSNGDRQPQPNYGKRSTATIILNSNAEPLYVEPSGFPDDPDPLPAITSELMQRSGEGPFTTGAADSSGERFRVLIQPEEDGTFRAIAAPLADVDDTIQGLAIIIAAAGLVVLLGLVGAVWIMIRRGLRPIDSMIETAGLIGEGDLSRRVDSSSPDTEVGRLSQALNDMLVQIEASFASKEASEQRLRQFVADASHELRTPLTSIRGYAELYRSGAAGGPEGVERVMARIESEGARMGQLVEDLLLLARLDQGRPLRKDLIDLVELVGFAVMDAQVTAPQREITFSHPAGAWTRGDKDRLRQVFDNLMTNARVHTDPSARIEVTIREETTEVSVAVRDTGAGIPEEEAERVFDRFYRADASRSRTSGGSGLGLSIVASIVEAHNGNVRLDTAVGKGTTVTISLPRIEPPAEAADDIIITEGPSPWSATESDRA